MKLVETRLFAKLLIDTPFTTLELIELINTAPARYKNHYINKRNGRGKRLISQPTKEVKYVQRYLIKTILYALPIHDAATAYRSGLSIRDHAVQHASNRYLLKLDFKDFFPSITGKGLNERLVADTNLSDLEVEIVVRMLCRHDALSDTLRLSIGAPSSPFVSNYFLHEFDKIIFEYCSALDVKYTRYADDLAFSTNAPRVLDQVQSYVLKILDQLRYLNLSLNTAKTVNVSKKNKRSLVGLTLSNEGGVSIGRESKRELRSQLHRASKGDLSMESFQKLKGRLAFLFSVDPAFVNALCRKYGVEKIADLTPLRKK